jgi:hypothetical protein
MAKISRPPVALPLASDKYDQRAENEFRRLVMQFLSDPVEDLVRPSLLLTVTPGATTTVIVVTWTGTMTYTIDGGAVQNGTTSPQTLNVARNVYGGAAKSYVFSVVNNGQTTTDTVVIPPQELNVTLAISACEANDAGAAGPPYNQLEIPFTYTGMPTGTTFDVAYNNGVADGVDSATGIAMTTSPQTRIFTSVTFGGAPGSGAVTVIAKLNGQTLTTAVRNKAYVT